MNLNYKPMSATERLYTCRQSQQITMQSGAIGYLSGDFGKTGAEFQSQWTDMIRSRNTALFQEELGDVVKAMREPGGALRDRYAMACFCELRESAAFQGKSEQEYAFRVDTVHYSYMLRCNPSPHDQNFFIYCYERVNLEAHMAVAQQGIRFITPDYQEKFRIQDGDSIRMTFRDGTRETRVCRYNDNYHLEVGRNLYHICEFAERMERAGATVIPLRSSLPEKCFAALETDSEMILVKKGEMGYEHTGIFPDGGQEKHEAADALNDAMGVTKAQAAAMLAGSMFGWDAPAADPRNYDEKGIPIRSEYNRDAR